MAYSYLFDPVAAKEYEDVFKWYEKKSYLAADNFIIRSTIIIISIFHQKRNPKKKYKKI
jgi:hypothetical protein